VHEQIGEVGRRWSLVFIGGEAGQAILVDVDAHRCYTIDKHVKSEIELVAVNQTRFGQVSLNNHVLDRLSLLVVAGQLVWVACQKYTLALARRFRLHDERLVPFITNHGHKLFEIVGKHESLRKKVEVRREFLLHAHEVFTEHVLFREVVNSRDVVAPLPGGHLREHLQSDGPVPPSKVPLGVRVLSQTEIMLKFRNFFYDIVVGLS
jgi:hypothetical protein